MRLARWWGAAAALTVLVGLAACAADKSGSGAPIDVPQLWVDRIDQALREPDVSDFERQVLSDYQVTDAEYKESEDRFVQCMANRGWAVTFDEGGGFGIAPLGGATLSPGATNADRDACDAATGEGTIGLVYREMRTNPSGASANELIIACFRANGLPDGQGVTPDQFGKMMMEPGYCPSSPAAKLCIMDPLGLHANEGWAGAAERWMIQDGCWPPTATATATP